MKCFKCGLELEMGMRFCPRCGERVEGDYTEHEEESDIEAKSSSACHDSMQNQGEILENNGGNENFPKTERKDNLISGSSVTESVDQGMIASETKDERDIKRKRSRIGFKVMLFIAFVAFFMPFCTVSCGNQTVLSSNGYELTGNWGLTESDMEIMEVESTDLANAWIIYALLFMVMAFVFQKRTVMRSVQVGVSGIILFCFRLSNRWKEIREVGGEVTFEFGYWLALTVLFLAATAAVWAPVLIERAEKIFAHSNDKEGLRKKMDSSLSAMLAIIIAIAFFLNIGAIKGWSSVIASSGRKVPDLRDNAIAETNYWDNLEEDIGETIQEKTSETTSGVLPTVAVPSTKGNTNSKGLVKKETVPETPAQEEYTEGLTKESVADSAYSSYDGSVTMEVGTYSGTGTIYINFWIDGQLVWAGDLIRTQALEYGGICLMFSGMNYVTGGDDYIEVEWSSEEAIDYPSVYCEYDTIGINGTYSYAYMLE